MSESFLDMGKSDEFRRYENDASTLSRKLQNKNIMTIDPKSLRENQIVSSVEATSLKNPVCQRLIKNLIHWINSTLREERIVVRNLETDLKDGCVLQKLIHKLTDFKINMPDVTQNRAEQKRKLGLILDVLQNKVFVDMEMTLRKLNNKCSIESIHDGNLVAVLHLLVTLAIFFHAPINIPENVKLDVILMRRDEKGNLEKRIIVEEITTDKDAMAQELTTNRPPNRKKDAFDTGCSLQQGIKVLS